MNDFSLATRSSLGHLKDLPTASEPIPLVSMQIAREDKRHKRINSAVKVA